MLNKAVGGASPHLAWDLCYRSRRAARLPSSSVASRPEELLRQSLILQQAQQQDPVNVSLAPPRLRRAYWAFLRNPLVRLHLYANRWSQSSTAIFPKAGTPSLDLDAPVVGVPITGMLMLFAAWSGARLPRLMVDLCSHERRKTLIPSGTLTSRALPQQWTTMLVPVSVQAYSSDRTLDGIPDMGGNVSEWTSTPEQVDQTGTLSSEMDWIKGVTTR